MAVYIDNSVERCGPIFGPRLFTDGDVSELLRVAKRIGLRPAWLRTVPTPYFVLSTGSFRRAINAGARLIDRDMLEVYDAPKVSTAHRVLF